MPTFIVALYSSGATASSFSQPGMAFFSFAGSRNASHTVWRAAGTSYEPSSFMPRVSFVRRDGRGLESYHGHGRCSLPRRVETPHKGGSSAMKKVLSAGCALPLPSGMAGACNLHDTDR